MTTLFCFFSSISPGGGSVDWSVFYDLEHLLETHMVSLVKFLVSLGGWGGSFYENAEMIDEWHKVPVERSRG